MRIAIVGCGSRHQMYLGALTGPYASSHQLVAVADPNPVRRALSLSAAGPGVRGYDSADYTRMLAEARPDSVIICTPDDTHAAYIIAALKAGCDVIVEKPLATSKDQLDEIEAAEAQTGRKVTVTFNYRYTPARTQLRQMLVDGMIGEVTAVTFRWALDRVHGGDYFRRWHRDKDRSGGLFVHKASHHFDLLSWWLDSAATEITATARRAYFTPETAARLGLEMHGTRCTGCPVAMRCPVALDLDAEPNLRALYRSAEGEDGYFRDACVFDPQIEIEDTYQAHIRYGSGVTCNYTLLNYAAWEGFEVTFLGTHGELTHRHVEVHGIFGGTRPEGEEERLTTTLHRSGGLPEQLKVAYGQGDHGGGDPLILSDLFGPGHASDPMNRQAGIRDGIAAVRTGLAARRAAETGKIEPV